MATHTHHTDGMLRFGEIVQDLGHLLSIAPAFLSLALALLGATTLYFARSRFIEVFTGTLAAVLVSALSSITIRRKFPQPDHESTQQALVSAPARLDSDCQHHWCGHERRPP